MPNISFSSSFGVKQKSVLSVKEFKKNYLFGVSLKDSFGREIQDSVIENAILESQAEVESILSIKLNLQLVFEDKNMYSEDWLKWGYIKTKWPVVCPKSLVGRLGELNHLEYPKAWLSVKSSSDETALGRNFYVVPFSATPFINHIAFSSSLHSVWWRNNGFIPNYWRLSYVTGFKEIPGDIKTVLSKYAAIRILILGGQSVVNNLRAGVGSTSISLDGLSQSVTPMGNSNAGPYGSVIKQYTADIENDLRDIKDVYCSINFAVC